MLYCKLGCALMGARTYSILCGPTQSSSFKIDSFSVSLTLSFACSRKLSKSGSARPLQQQLPMWMDAVRYNMHNVYARNLSRRAAEKPMRVRNPKSIHSIWRDKHVPNGCFYHSVLSMPVSVRWMPTAESHLLQWLRSYRRTTVQSCW